MMVPLGSLFLSLLLGCRVHAIYVLRARDENETRAILGPGIGFDDDRNLTTAEFGTTSSFIGPNGAVSSVMKTTKRVESSTKLVSWTTGVIAPSTLTLSWATETGAVAPSSTKHPSSVLVPPSNSAQWSVHTASSTLVAASPTLATTTSAWTVSSLLTPVPSVVFSSSSKTLPSSKTSATTSSATGPKFSTLEPSFPPGTSMFSTSFSRHSRMSPSSTPTASLTSLPSSIPVSPTPEHSWTKMSSSSLAFSSPLTETLTSGPLSTFTGFSTSISPPIPSLSTPTSFSIKPEPPVSPLTSKVPTTAGGHSADQEPSLTPAMDNSKAQRRRLPKFIRRLK